MACGGCAKRRAAVRATGQQNAETRLMDGFKYMTARQLTARLEAYKRKYCKDCKTRFKCDYANYVKCKENNIT